MSVRASQWAWDIIACGRTSSAGESLVLLRLADRADPEGVCWPGSNRTAKDLRMTPRGVQKCIQRLQAAGLLRVQKRAAHNGKTLTNCFHLSLDVRGECSSPLQNMGEDELRSPPGANGVRGGGRTVVPPHVEPPIDNHKKEPPPAATGGGTTAAVAGGGQQLFDLAVKNGLSNSAARRFASAAVGATEGQLEALQHELSVRLAGARDRTATAIRLAQLATSGQLDDTTRATREAAALQARRHAAQATQQALEKQRAAEAAALRAERGPSAAELACRALVQRIRGEKK